MTLKQEHLVVGLIGLGAVAVIVFLVYEGRQQSGGGAVAEVPVPVPGPGAAQSPAYPNAPTPINFEVGGSPVNLTYNTFPADFSPTGTQVRPLDSACGNGGCDGCGTGCDSCTQTQQPVTVQSVPPSVLAGAADNFSTFVAKAAPVRAAARVTSAAGSGGGRASFSAA